MPLGCRARGAGGCGCCNSIAPGLSRPRPRNSSLLVSADEEFIAPKRSLHLAPACLCTCPGDLPGTQLPAPRPGKPAAAGCQGLGPEAGSPGACHPNPAAPLQLLPLSPLFPPSGSFTLRPLAPFAGEAVGRHSPSHPAGLGPSAGAPSPFKAQRLQPGPHFPTKPLDRAELLPAACPPSACHVVGIQQGPPPGDGEPGQSCLSQRPQDAGLVFEPMSQPLSPLPTANP